MALRRKVSNIEQNTSASTVWKNPTTPLSLPLRFARPHRHLRTIEKYLNRKSTPELSSSSLDEDNPISAPRMAVLPTSLSLHHAAIHLAADIFCGPIHKRVSDTSDEAQYANKRRVL